MNQLYGYSVGTAKLMMILMFFVDSKHCSWQLHEGHDGRFAGLGSKKLDQNLLQDTIGKPTSRAIDWHNNNVVGYFINV